jgi:hypothetical protein
MAFEEGSNGRFGLAAGRGGNEQRILTGEDGRDPRALRGG